MVFWSLVLAVSAVLPALGAGLDKFFMTKESRTAWYDSLLRWWMWLEDSPVATLPSRAAAGFGSMLDRVLGLPSSGARFLLRSIFTSLMATGLCVLVGRAWDHGFRRLLQYDEENLASYLTLFPLLTIANYPFDMATLLSTRWVLRRAERSAPLLGVLWISADVAFAILLAWACAALVIPGRIAVGFERFDGIVDLETRMQEYPRWLISHFQSFHSHKYLLMSASMLIPTAIFGILFVTLLLAKLALGIGKRFLQALIEEHSPAQLPVFTALAFLASLGNAVAMVTVKVASSLAP